MRSCCDRQAVLPIDLKVSLAGVKELGNRVNYLACRRIDDVARVIYQNVMPIKSMANPAFLYAVKEGAAWRLEAAEVGG